jgi:hypothetical protein
VAAANACRKRNGYRPYKDNDSILINMSVWETVDSLKNYVYSSAHAELLRQRHEWFEKLSGI